MITIYRMWLHAASLLSRAASRGVHGVMAYTNWYTITPNKNANFGSLDRSEGGVSPMDAVQSFSVIRSSRERCLALSPWRILSICAGCMSCVAALASEPAIIVIAQNALEAAVPTPVVADAHMKIVGGARARVWDTIAFRSADGKFVVDVSRYERVSLRLIDWPVDELMYFLEGSVEVSDSNGRSKRYGPGTQLLMPHGFNGLWRQLSAIKKIAVTYAPASASSLSHTDWPEIDSDPRAALRGTADRMKPIEPWAPFMDIVGSASGRYIEVPIYASADKAVEIHVKRFEPVTLDLKNWPIDEFMHFLSGHLEIRARDGARVVCVAGDTIVIPKGFSGTWRQADAVDMLTAAYETAAH